MWKYYLKTQKKHKKKPYKFLILIPALWACFLDELFTIVYQPASYWSGNLDLANEANPIGAFVMRNYVSGIFIISVLWLIIIAFVGYYLPRKWSKIFALFILLIHSREASSLLMSRYGFWSAIILFAVNSIFFVLMEELHTKKITL